MAELRAAPDLVPRTYDLAHLRALHRHLFQDIYEWAGNIRQVGIAKGGESFAPPSNIQQPVSHVAQRLRGNDLLRTLDGPALAREVAYTYDYLNYAHPFREGNGRTQREFFDLLLAETHRGIAWDLVDSSMLHHACHQARAESDLTELETMFSRILDNSPGYDLDPG